MSGYRFYLTCENSDVTQYSHDPLSNGDAVKAVTVSQLTDLLMDRKLILNHFDKTTLFPRLT